MERKTFTEVTSPKSRMSANSITGANIFFSGREHSLIYLITSAKVNQEERTEENGGESVILLRLFLTLHSPAGSI